jgi:hypothetical protein
VTAYLAAAAVPGENVGRRKLPFSHDAFLDLFRACNGALWPAVTALWAATAVAAIRFVRSRSASGRATLALLAIHWSWSGVAYHWLYFRTINPAAALFAAVFVAQGAWYALLAMTPRARFQLGPGVRGGAAAALIIYGLAYPAMGLLAGLRYPRMPVFAVPCPTTLVTAGFLIASRGLPRLARVVPMLWALIGASAAILLGILPDVALVAAAAALALDVRKPAAHAPSPAGSIDSGRG